MGPQGRQSVPCVGRGARDFLYACPGNRLALRQQPTSAAQWHLRDSTELKKRRNTSELRRQAHGTPGAAPFAGNPGVPRFFGVQFRDCCCWSESPSDMRDFPMRFLGAVALCAFLVSASVAEDAQLRPRAFELVERAQEVSAPKQSAPIVNETVLTFHALSADGSMREGSYSRVFAGPTGTR